MTIELTIHPETPDISPHQMKSGKAPGLVNNDFFGGFAGLLDVVNPLQHIPIVSDIYQAVTGDKIDVGAKIAGGVLFGGPIGLLASIANLVFEQETGKNIGGALMASVTGSYEKTAQLTAQAAGQTTPALS